MPIANDVTISPLTQTSPSQAPTASPAATSGLGSLTSSDFLQLLVAQITNQDPLNPVSSSQFMSQTAELSTLEQITALSQETTQMSSAQQTGAAIQAIGKTATGISETGGSVTGKVAGVEATPSGPLLEIGGSLVALSSVTSIT